MLAAWSSCFAHMCHVCHIRSPLLDHCSCAIISFCTYVMYVIYDYLSLIASFAQVKKFVCERKNEPGSAMEIFSHSTHTIIDDFASATDFVEAHALIHDLFLATWSVESLNPILSRVYQFSVANLLKAHIRTDDPFLAADLKAGKNSVCERGCVTKRCCLLIRAASDHDIAGDCIRWELAFGSVLFSSFSSHLQDLLEKMLLHDILAFRVFCCRIWGSWNKRLCRARSVRSIFACRHDEVLMCSPSIDC